jgi:hypothetical protein
MKWTSILLLFVIFTGIRHVTACSCVGPPTVQESLARADAVFTGEVTRVSAITPYSGRATMKVERTWKGIHAPVVTMAARSSTCDVTFALGQRWLIYANNDGTYYRTDACSRSRLLRSSHVQQDLQELGPGAAPFDGIPQTFLWGGLMLFLVGTLRMVVLRRSGKSS